MNRPETNSRMPSSSTPSNPEPMFPDPKEELLRLLEEFRDTEDERRAAELKTALLDELYSRLEKTATGSEESKQISSEIVDAIGQ